MTSQPKYKFGDKFKKISYTEVEGVSHKVEVVHVVTGILAKASSESYYYIYRLSSSYPTAYNSPAWNSNFMAAEDIEAKYEAVTNE